MDLEKVDRIIKTINLIAKAEDDDLDAEIPDQEGKEKIIGWVNDFESKVAKILRKQRKHFVKGIEGMTTKDAFSSMTLAQLLAFLENDLFADDPFEEEMSEETQAFLTMTITELSSEIMESIDKDVAFETLSGRTTKWIEDWAEDLANLMKLNSHDAIKKELTEVLENGEGIPKAVERMKDLPQFSRTRARTTAITEILTASSRSQWESYQQSPAVEGKKWRHSGKKKNKPREEHEDLDGTVIGVDEQFDVNGHDADYPRDPSLPASERVNCHCAMSPSVNRKILGLSVEEKEEIRQQVLKDLEE